MSRILTFLTELKRRRVYHVVVVYAAAAFVSAQAAEIFLPRLGLPDWTVTLLVILAVAGFPVALILGWTFDITPTGIHRTGPEAEQGAVGRSVQWRVAGGAAAATVVLIAGGWWLSSLAFDPRPSGVIERLAVLPLANLMDDSQQDYFVQGMHDALIAELAQAGIGVIARASVMRYQETDKSVREIARELNVGAVISGSVLRAEHRVRIQVQLIHGSTETHLWVQTYDAELGDVLTLHRRITRQVAAEIQARLSPAAEARLAGAQRVDPEVYDTWLRGRFHADRWTARDSDIALQYFELALAIDPEYAPAHAGVAHVWHVRRQDGRVPPREAGPRVMASVMSALELDEELPDAHLIRGMDAAWGDWDWAAAERAFRRSISINPNYAQARAPYSHLLFTIGRPQEAMVQIERALELDPFNPFVLSIHGINLIFSRRYDEAIAQLRRTLAIDPEHGLARHHLKRAYALNGNYEDAFAALRSTIPPSHELIEALELSYAADGYVGALRTLADIRAAEARAGGVVANMAAWAVARVYVQVEEVDRAFEWLEKAFEARDANLPYIAVDPDFDPIRSDPRFQSLLQRMNLPG